MHGPDCAPTYFIYKEPQLNELDFMNTGYYPNTLFHPLNHICTHIYSYYPRSRPTKIDCWKS